MFEREIKFIYDFNLNKVNRLGPYFTFEQLTSAEIHPAILNYISAEIDYLIFEDRQNLLKNSMFDYSGEKISNYFVAIGEEVKKTKRFALDYISKIILHASSFTVNYLVRPKWTLRKFVFDEGDHKTTLEIKQILNYTHYYQYLKKILISYINSKKILSMNSEEFGELLEKVDKLGVETNLPNILSNATKSMADFFNIGEIQKSKIPLLAIETFLEEKQLSNHLQKIRDVFGEDKNQKINLFDLKKAIESIVVEKVETIPSEKPTSEEVYEEPIEPIKPVIAEKEEVIQEAETSEELLNDAEPKEKPTKLRIKIDDGFEVEKITEDESDSPLPMDEELADNLEEEDDEKLNEFEEIENEFESEEEILEQHSLEEKEEEIDSFEIDEPKKEEEVLMENTAEVYSEEQIQSNESKEYMSDMNDEQDEESMLQSILHSEDEQDKSSEKERLDESSETQKAKFDIAELLEHKEMTKIIEVIFDYDIEEFANTLDEISDCTSLDDAYVVLNQSLKNHNVGRNSKEAEAFRSIISQYFNRT